MKYFNEDGHLNDEGFALYADAIKLNKVDQLPKEVVDYVASNSKCQQELVDFVSIMLDVEQEDLAAHPTFSKTIVKEEKKEARSINIFFKYAAAAAVLLLLFFTYQKFKDNPQQELVQEEKVKPAEQNDDVKPNENKIDDQQLAESPEKNDSQAPLKNTPDDSKVETPEPSVNNRELYAANFIANEEFETLIGTTFRSDAVEINFPQNNTVFKLGAEVTFNWEGAIPLNLIILDNEEETIYEGSISSVPFKLGQALNPGLYYWKLETEDDLLHLGKFTVE